MTSNYTYDRLDRMITAPGGTGTTYQYDDNNRVTKRTIAMSAGNKVTDYVYNDAGLITGLTNKHANTVISQYT